MNIENYVSGKRAKEILGVHTQTLYNWEKNGKLETIRTAGGQRHYNVKKYMELYANPEIIKEDKIEEDKIEKSTKKINICYVRVSTLNQKDDLERQKKYMLEKYPTYNIIEDIGSGINFNRKGLRRIINFAISGKINRVVVAHKDRLTRFGFELIEDLIKEYSKGEIILDDKIDKKLEAKDELVEDVLQILNVYTAKLNGMRKYSKKK
jgi:putative resolvase